LDRESRPLDDPPPAAAGEEPTEVGGRLSQGTAVEFAPHPLSEPTSGGPGGRAHMRASLGPVPQSFPSELPDRQLPEKGRDRERHAEGDETEPWYRSDHDQSHDREER